MYLKHTIGEQYAYVPTTGKQYVYVPTTGECTNHRWTVCICTNHRWTVWVCTTGEQYQSYMNSYNYRWTVTITGEQLQPHKTVCSLFVDHYHDIPKFFKHLENNAIFPKTSRPGKMCLSFPNIFPIFLTDCMNPVTWQNTNMKVWPSPHKQTLVISPKQTSQSQEKHVVHNLPHDLYGTSTQSSNRTRPKALLQDQHTRELISAWNT